MAQIECRRRSTFDRTRRQCTSPIVPLCIRSQVRPSVNRYIVLGRLRLTPDLAPEPDDDVSTMPIASGVDGRPRFGLRRNIMSAVRPAKMSSGTFGHFGQPFENPLKGLGDARLRSAMQGKVSGPDPKRSLLLPTVWALLCMPDNRPSCWQSSRPGR
jgi:hypothetical protein